MKNPLNEVKRRADHARKELYKYSDKRIAEVLDVSVPTYMKLRDNPSQLTVTQLSKLANYMNCSLSDFLFTDEVK